MSSPKAPFLKDVETDPGQLRIAFTAFSPAEGSVHKDCVQAVRDAASLCSSLGHAVEEGSPKIPGEWVREHFMVLWSAGVAWVIDGLGFAAGQKPDASRFEPLTWALYETGRKHSASAYLISLIVLERIARQIAQFFTKFDLWLTPTISEPRVSLDTFDSPARDSPGGSVYPLHSHRQHNRAAGHVCPPLLEPPWPSRRGPFWGKIWR